MHDTSELMMMKMKYYYCNWSFFYSEEMYQHIHLSSLDGAKLPSRTRPTVFLLFLFLSAGLMSHCSVGGGTRSVMIIIVNRIICKQ